MTNGKIDPVTVVTDGKDLNRFTNIGATTDSSSTLAGYKPVERITYRDHKKQQWKAKTAKISQGIGQGINSFSENGGMDLLGAGLGLTASLVSKDTKHNPTGFEAQQQIGSALMKFPNPIVQAAGAAYTGLSQIAEAAGGNVNTITKEQADDIGLKKGTRLLNNIVGTLHPGAGWLTTKIEEGQKSHLIDGMRNAYADTVADINQAGVLGGGKYLFGSKQIEGAVQEANRRNQLLTDISMTNTMRKQSDYGRDLAQQNLNRYAGTNYMDMRMGKHGMKFLELDNIRELLNNRVFESDIQKFAEGGSILPVGSRHKNLNHLSEINPELRDLTRKGIPVVTLNEGGEIEQIAEIECNEWTLSKSLTDQIEALWKDGSEEAMIECGKIVCDELLRNTKDEGNVLELEKESENGND